MTAITVMENFFGLLKSELLYLRDYRSFEESQEEISKVQETAVNAEKFMRIVPSIPALELTPTLLRELVEKIVIYEAESLDGKRHGKLRRQNIDI